MTMGTKVSAPDRSYFGRPLSESELDGVAGGFVLATAILPPRDAATSQATGRRVELPIQVTTPVGATP